VCKGACNDSFTSPNFDLLIQTPPTSLFQNYYECVPSGSSVFISAAGVAAGNMSTLLPLVVIILLAMLYSFLKCRKMLPEKEPYDGDERDNIIRELATLMLLVDYMRFGSCDSPPE
jgi:hypothetical protein